MRNEVHSRERDEWKKEAKKTRTNESWALRGLVLCHEEVCGDYRAECNRKISHTLTHSRHNLLVLGVYCCGVVEKME